MNAIAPVAAASAVLGVERSAAGRRWVWRAAAAPDAVDRLGRALADREALPEIVGRLLSARGVTPEGAADFLAPTIRRSLPDPSVLRDMDRAASRLADAIARRETVGILGDYDVDGACATAILADALRALGCSVLTHIPDRLAEGYGPNRPAIERLLLSGATLVVTADCGAASADVLEPLAPVVDVVVLDHHRTTAVPRGIVATVDPNRPDDCSGLGHLCAAAVVFLALVATFRELRRAGRFAAPDLPDLRRSLDLVALATICDVVPLVGVNRAFVTAGLRVLADRSRPGLAALLALGCKGRPADAFSCGYALGPRINAGGRLGDSSLGVRLLTTTDPDEAARIAAMLDEVNGRRRTVEASIVEAAIDQAARQIEDKHPTIVVQGEEWHPGVVGIVASRVRERFNRPACVGAAAGDGVKGSGRSVPGLDLGGAIVDARAHGLLDTGGGHAMAAGYGHAADGRGRLHDFLDRRLAAAAARSGTEDLGCDAVLRPEAATLPLAEALGRLEPFGPGNDEPLLVLNRGRVVRADRLGADGRTVRMFVGGDGGSGRLKAMLFRAAEDSPLAPLLLAADARPLHLAGRLRVETWQGEAEACFVIEDAAPAI